MNETQNQIAVNEIVTECFNVEIVTLTPEQKHANKIAAWQKWGNGMSMLRAIHGEIAPKLQALKEARLDVYDEKFEVNMAPTNAEMLALEKQLEKECV